MKLFNHQKEATKFILQNAGKAAIFHSIGMGKTLTALTAYKALRHTKPDLKMVVICPLSLIEGAWGEDIVKFTNYRYRNLHEKRKTKQKRPPFDIYIANYEWLLHNDLTRFVPDGSLIVLDESSKMKNHQSKITKRLLELRDRYPYRVIMSGTPAPNNETEYWAQMRFIDSSIFHKSFYAFRNRFFHFGRGKQVLHGMIMSKQMMQQAFAKGFKLEITADNREHLARKMSPWTHYAKKEECLDLPDRIDENRIVYMDPEQTKAYKEMKQQCITEILGQEIVAQVALTKIMKLRQITSGFALDPEGRAHPVGKNPKLKELMEILEEAGKQQVIIWAVFHYEIERIAEVLGDKAVTMYGKTKDKQESVMAFKEGRAQYLVAHPRSAGHGLTFVNSSLQVFFSLDYSWELYEQAKGRTHRPGQKNNCTYVHILADETIDKSVLNVLQKKGEAVEIVNEFLKQGVIC